MLGVAGDKRQHLVKSHLSASRNLQGLEPLEPRVLLSGSGVSDVLIDPISASGKEVLASVVGNNVVLEQTQYNNFFKPNIITFDFPIEPSAVNGRIDITALSDLDATGEVVAFDIEGIVSGELWTGTDDGVRPFTATINLTDADLAAIAADGNLHIEFTPNSNVDDFYDVDEYVTVSLSYEGTPAPITLTPVTPRLMGAYQGSVNGTFENSSEVNAYSVTLEAGQSLRLEAVPHFDQSLVLQVLDPTGAVIYSGGSAFAGGPILPQSVAVNSDGNYTIIVMPDAGSAGPYALNVFVNEWIEYESIGGAQGDSLDTAQDVNDYFRDLGHGIEQAVIRGSIPTYSVKGNASDSYTYTESFENGVLPDSWEVTAGAGTIVSSAYGAADGSYALLMHSPTVSDRLNEVVWTIDLDPGRKTTLTFDYAEWADSFDPLPYSYTGSANGDGVSISPDGITWYRVFDAWNTPLGSWNSTYSISLNSIARYNGFSLGADTRIKFQQYGGFALPNDGRGYDKIRIDVRSDFEFYNSTSDYYSFTLDAGDRISLNLENLGSAGASFMLFNPNGESVTDSIIYRQDGYTWLTDFQAQIAGTYTVSVIHSYNYLLSITKNGSVEVQTNNALTGAQQMGQTDRALGALDDANPSDFYIIPVQAGDILTIETTTPGGGISGLNNLDPGLSLYLPDETLLMVDSNGAADGRNALITHTATETGEYYIQISRSTGEGQYTLSVDGATGVVDEPLKILADTVSIADDSVFTTKPYLLTFKVDGLIAAQSVDLSDLLINGAPTAESVVIRNDGLWFRIPETALLQGQNTLTLAAGQISDLQGNANEELGINFYLDDIFPRIIESSILAGDILPAGETTITVKFSEPVLMPELLAGRFVNYYSSIGIESTIAYNQDTYEFTATFYNLIEGQYYFRINDSVVGYITDQVGLQLDGEPATGTTVPSGNGLEGGAFSIPFYIEDGSSEPLIPTVDNIEHLADFVYEATFSDLPVFVGDENRFTFNLVSGQNLTVTIDDRPGLSRVDLEVYAPDGTMIASTVGGAAEIYDLDITASGTYTLLTRCTRLGPTPTYYQYYNGRIRVNAVHEDELPDDWTNDDIATAEDINPYFFTLDDGVDQAVVLGQLPYDPYNESFETGHFGPNWQSVVVGNSANSRLFPTDDFGGADGDYALAMSTTSFNNGYLLNEAIWTVDLTGFNEAGLSFSHKMWQDDSDVLPEVFEGHYNGDGVAISADGIVWYTLLNAPDELSSNWYDYEFDLLAASAAAGITPGQDFKIKFQQYGYAPISTGGQLYDDIRIVTSPSPVKAHDVYRVDLAAGQELSSAVYGGNEPIGVEVLDSLGNPLAAGEADWWDEAKGSIRGFIAPTEGSYYLRITGYWDPYTLTITRGATYVPEPALASDSISLGPSGKMVSAFYEADATQTDNYHFNVNAGDELSIWTTTPDFLPLSPVNTLNTYLQLYGPDNQLIVESGSGGAGLNAAINHTATQSGTYTVKLNGVNTLPDEPAGLQGGYILHVVGNTGSPSPLLADTTDFEDGQQYTDLPTGVTVQFSEPIRLDSLSPSDLIINGVPAESVEIIDGNTVIFNSETGFVQGVNSLILEDGSILGLDGRSVLGFSRQFTLDSIAPRIISSTITDGDMLEPGRILMSFTFDDALDLSNLSVSGVQISSNQYYYPRPTIDYFEYDPDTSILSIGFDTEYEGEFILTLYDHGFTDLAGNQLDGENPGAAIPPGVSGDGTAGGDFVVAFEIDRDTYAGINEPAPLAPSGSLAYVSQNHGALNAGDDVDFFEVFVQAGQTVTARLSALYNDSYLMYLTGPDGQTVQGEAGDPIFFTYTNDGPDTTVSFDVYGDATYEAYNFDVYINTVSESSLPYLPGGSDAVYDLSGLWQSQTGLYGTTTIIGTSQPDFRSTVTGIQASITRYISLSSAVAPIGDGTLTITAMGDLEASDKYLTINFEDQFTEQVFVLDGLEGIPATTTMTIPQAALEAMAANGSIRFEITPSGSVASYPDSFVTLELDYPGLPGPRYDTYAIELEAGQTFNAYLDPDYYGFEMALIDSVTGRPVEATLSATNDYAFPLDYTATTAGRFDLRIYANSTEEYRLTMHRGVAFDSSFIDTPVAAAINLDNISSALGSLRSPGPESLLAIRGVQSYASTYTIDTQTFEFIEQINNTLIKSPTGLFLAQNVTSDGAYIFAHSSRGLTYVIDPNSGEVIDNINIQSQSLPRYIGYYNGELITLEVANDGAKHILFVNPQTGEVTHQLDLPSNSDITYYDLAGAATRGSIFIVAREVDSYHIEEYDVATGQRVNRFALLFDGLATLAYVDNKVFSLNYLERTIRAYDPDTGQLLASHTYSEASIADRVMAIGGDALLPVMPTDRYSLTLNVGDSATLWTETPFDHPSGIPLNDLDPAIRLLDPLGNMVAFDDNSAADGNNASLSFTATIPGVYTIEVQATAGSGEYLLQVDADRVLLGDLDGDGFVGLADLDILLGNWNLTVPVGDLALGDASGDGFIGLDDLDLILGNWNASLPPTQIEGDLDIDGYVGLNDLDIVLGNWNTDATADQRSDPSGDGFVGLDDLDLVLNNWNEGTPPATEMLVVSASESVESASAASTSTRSVAKTNKRPWQTQHSNDVTAHHQRDTHAPAVASSWLYMNQHSQRASDEAYLPWTIQQQDQPAVLGLWEEHE